MIAFLSEFTKTINLHLNFRNLHMSYFDSFDGLLLNKKIP